MQSEQIRNLDPSTYEMQIGLDAPNIRSYFECKNNSVPAPVEEFLYANTHPLQTPNFIQELNFFSFRANTRMQAVLPTLSPKAIEALTKTLTEIATNMGEIVGNSPTGMAALNEEDSKKVLFYMRRMYQVYKTILDTK